MKLISLFIVCTVLAQNAWANTDLSTQKEALKIISDFAIEFCETAPLEGGTEGLTLTGDASLRLDGLLKKISDIGLGGSIDYSNKKYNSVLQKDLAALLKQDSNCRLKVWEDLRDKLIFAPDQSNVRTLYFETNYISSYDESGVYDGEVKNELPDGFGNLVVKVDGKKMLSYEGDFNAGLFHGEGRLINYDSNPFGEIFLIGQFESGKFIKGEASLRFDTYTFPTSHQGSGVIMSGTYSGEVIGTLINPAYPYDDLSDLAVPHGKGVFKYFREDKNGPSRQFTFDGEWKQGSFTGSGIIYLPNDGYVKGEFIYGYLSSGTAKNISFGNSWGVEVPFSGKYSGEVVSSEFNGNGKLTSTSSTFPREFQGTFKDGEFWTGKGIAPSRSNIEEDIWPYGKYGTWKNGEFVDGTWSFVASDGVVYRNTLSNGKVIKQEIIGSK